MITPPKNKHKKEYKSAIRYICNYLKKHGINPYSNGFKNTDRIIAYMKLKNDYVDKFESGNLKTYIIEEWKKNRNKKDCVIKKPQKNKKQYDYNAEAYNGKPIIVSKKKKQDDVILKLQEDMYDTIRRFDENINKERYQLFLKTKYWAHIRKLKLAQQPTCICGADKYLQVHHLTYKNHYHEHEHLDDLVVLCRTCHKDIHKNKK